MNIDRGSFLILVSTLAIGAAGGYVTAEKRLLPAVDKWRGRPPEYSAPEPPKPTPVADAAPPAALPPPPPAPTCDDSAATVGECPPPGYPTVEGGCGSFANIRCSELKQSVKPKVAQAVVTCLNKLTTQERCDTARVTLCGHLALVNACPERDADGDGGASFGPPGGLNASTPQGAPTGAHAVGATCQAIIAGCGASPIAPSITECRQLLSGMNDTGRERTRACMKNHCFDRGLVGCEAVVHPK